MPRPPPPSSLSGRLRQWWHRLTGRPTAPAASDAVDVGRAGGLSPDAAPGPAVVAGGGSWVGGDYAGPAGGRHYRLYRPPVAVTASAPLPLIVMLHGCRQTAEDFAVGTRMNRLAGREGFAVLYPEQSREQNPMGCWNWFLPEHQQRGRGEPEIIAGLTREVIAAHGLDADRIYVAGLSAGGAMATIVGNEYPDIYAAIAVHSGLRQGAAASVAAALAVMRDGRERGSAESAASRGAKVPLPTIIFHGDEDTTVHPANGAALFSAFDLPAENPGAAAPGQRDETVVEARPDQHGYRRSTVREPDGQVLAEYWRLSGGGHAWSGGDPRGSFTDARGPDAAAECLRFFLQHRRRAVPSGA